MTHILLGSALASVKLVMLAALLMATGPVAAQQLVRPSASTRSLRSALVPADIFALQQVSDVQLSPDGRQLVYQRLRADQPTDVQQARAWLLDVATGRQRQLLPAAASDLRWSPDGQHLAYVAADSGGHAQVFVHELASGTNRCLSHLSEAPSNLAWSPDGRALAFTMFVFTPALTLW